MTHNFGSIDELGDGYGFRKVRTALGVTAFGVNAIVYPPGFDGFLHYHDEQDELYFVHAGTALVRGRRREHASSAPEVSATSRRRRRARCRTRATDDLVLLVVGGKDGYVEPRRTARQPGGRRAPSIASGASGWP